MCAEEKLAKLTAIGEIEVVGNNGEFLCKHEDGMIKNGGSIAAYFMYMPTREVAINHYFDYVTQPGTSILLMPNFKEFKYNGNEFIEIAK